MPRKQFLIESYYFMWSVINLTSPIVRQKCIALGYVHCYYVVGEKCSVAGMRRTVRAVGPWPPSRCLACRSLRELGCGSAWRSRYRLRLQCGKNVVRRAHGPNRRALAQLMRPPLPPTLSSFMVWGSFFSCSRPPPRCSMLISAVGGVRAGHLL